MQTSQRRSLLACFLVLAIAGQAWAARLDLAARDALIGKWTAEVTPDDNNGKPFNDTLTLKGGNFNSDTLLKQGFQPATYDESPAPLGMAAKFSVTLKNAAGDTATWSGFSTGTQLEGTLVVTKKDGPPVSYSFKATK